MWRKHRAWNIWKLDIGNRISRQLPKLPSNRINLFVSGTLPWRKTSYVHPSSSPNHFFGGVDILRLATLKKKVAECKTRLPCQPQDVDLDQPWFVIQVDIQPFTSENSTMRWCVILHRNQVFNILPSTDYWHDFILQLGAAPFIFHGILSRTIALGRI